jgi:hypothetical protein
MSNPTVVKTSLEVWKLFQPYLLQGQYIRIHLIDSCNDPVTAAFPRELLIVDPGIPDIIRRYAKRLI